MKRCVNVVVAMIVCLASLQAWASTGCELTYFAKTADHRGNVFVCSNQSNVIFAYGQVEATNPEVLLVVPKNKVLIKTYESVKLGPVGYELYIPNGNTWYVVSSKLLSSTLFLVGGGQDVYQTSLDKLDRISALGLDKVDERNKLPTTKGVLNITEDINVR